MLIFNITGLFLRGRWRIRTAVHGFADRCLATRPTDRFQGANIGKFLWWENRGQKIPAYRSMVTLTALI